VIQKIKGKWIVLALFRVQFSFYAQKRRSSPPQWCEEHRKRGKNKETGKLR
jgi:hypothetical protein